jgi:biopolymer transport protein ExbD
MSSGARTGLVIAVIIVLLAIAAVATGFINLSGNSGELPKVAVQGGELPSVDADVGSVGVGSTSTTVEVPKVEVGTTSEKVELPTVEVKKAGE